MYHPRFFLVTTPSYTFNARFSTPAELEEGQEIRVGGHPDPTGRTSRVFRHPDHKFEWTVEEFTDWCNATARQWGYHVDVDGIGKPVEKDEWGRDAQLGFASQVALFARIDGEAAASAREEAVKKTLRQHDSCNHELLAKHHHVPHPRSGSPLAAQDIIDIIKQVMEQCQDSLFTVQALWNEDEIACACAGDLDGLLDAVAGSNELLLHRHKVDWREEWEVELIGGVQAKQDLWTEKSGPDSDDEFPACSSSESEGANVMGKAEINRGSDWGTLDSEPQHDWRTSWEDSTTTCPSGSGWGVAYTEEVN